MVLKLRTCCWTTVLNVKKGRLVFAAGYMKQVYCCFCSEKIFLHQRRSWLWKPDPWAQHEVVFSFDTWHCFTHWNHEDEVTHYIMCFWTFFWVDLHVPQILLFRPSSLIAHIGCRVRLLRYSDALMCWGHVSCLWVFLPKLGLLRHFSISASHLLPHYAHIRAALWSC